MDGFHVKHVGAFNDIDENTYDVTIYEKNGIDKGSSTELIFADDAIDIAQVKKDNLLGSKCTINLLSFEEEAYLHLYNGREGDYLIEIKDHDNTFIWLGVIIPGYYSEDFAEAPFNVKLQAVDGLGRLNEMYTRQQSIALKGRSLWLEVLDALWQCSGILEVLVCNKIKAQTISIFDAYTTDYMLFEANGKKKSLYKMLQEVCKTFDFSITQRNGCWVMYNEQLAAEESDVLEFDVWRLDTKLKTGTRELLVRQTANHFVYEGGIKSIIPPISTLDLTWTRETYNAGTDSNFFNPLFKNDFEGWTRTPLANEPGWTEYANGDPIFIEDYYGKSALKPQALLMSELLSYWYTLVQFGLKSFPLPIREAGTFGLSMEYYFTRYKEGNALLGKFVYKVRYRDQSNTAYWLKEQEIEYDGETLVQYVWDENNEQSIAIDLNRAYDTWSTTTIVPELNIPGPGTIEVFVDAIFHRAVEQINLNELQEIMDMGLNSVNLYSLDGGEKTFKESIRIQSDTYGFADKESVELFYANKREIFADGNLYNKAIEFIPGFEYKSKAEIQYLLAAKMFNKRRKPLESLNIEVKGIIPTVSLLSYVPGREGRLYEMDELKSYDLRNNRTKAIFTQRNTVCEPVTMDIYNDDILVTTRVIGCSNEDDPTQPPTIDEVTFRHVDENDNKSVIGLNAALHIKGSDYLELDCFTYGPGITKQLFLTRPNGIENVYDFPYWNRLYFRPVRYPQPAETIELYEGGTYDFRIVATGPTGATTTYQRQIGIAII